MTPTILAPILQLYDDGETNVAAIAAALSVSPGYVYGVLRQHRPNRPRSPRTRTSETRRKIIGLAARGIKAPRVAFLCGCTPAYVYRILGEEANP